MKFKFKLGFSLVELLISLSIVAVLGAIILNTFVDFRKHQALTMDTDLVVEVLRQARNQTLSSKNASVYGVHFESNRVILFTGSSYVQNHVTNQNFVMGSSDTVLTASLNPSGNNIVFSRLTGETLNYGTVVVSSPNISGTKTVTIYKTGLTELQ